MQTTHRTLLLSCCTASVISLVISVFPFSVAATLPRGRSLFADLDPVALTPLFAFVGLLGAIAAVWMLPRAERRASLVITSRFGRILFGGVSWLLGTVILWTSYAASTLLAGVLALLIGSRASSFLYLITIGGVIIVLSLLGSFTARLAIPGTIPTASVWRTTFQRSLYSALAAFLFISLATIMSATYAATSTNDFNAAIAESLNAPFGSAGMPGVGIDLEDTQLLGMRVMQTVIGILILVMASLVARFLILARFKRS